MAGPNLELFKFSLYLFFPLAIMVHYGDPQWYHDNVLPFRNRFWPDEATLYKPPRNSTDLKIELAELRALRLSNKERREQGLPPLPTPIRNTTISSSSPSPVSRSSSNITAENNTWNPSLRPGASLGLIGMKASTLQSIPAQRAHTWRETWQEARERHVV